MNRWIRLETDYINRGFVLRFIKLQELWNITLCSSDNSIETYMAKVCIRSKNLKRMGAPIDRWILVVSPLNILDGKHKESVNRLVTQLDDMPDSDNIVTHTPRRGGTSYQARQQGPSHGRCHEETPKRSGGEQELQHTVRTHRLCDLRSKPATQTLSSRWSTSISMLRCTV